MKNNIKKLIVGALMVVLLPLNAFAMVADAPAGQVRASTLAANTVTNTSMTLRGNYLGTGSGARTTWFEYGTNYESVMNGGGQSVGYSSQGNTSGTFTYTLNNLLPNTVYYFRAGTSQDGQFMRGNTLWATTTNTVTPPPQTYAPTLSSITPSSGYQGSNYTVTLYGANFVSGSNVNFGSGINVNSVTVNSSTQLTASISISSSASTGSHSVYVTNSNGTSNMQYFVVNTFYYDTCSSGAPVVYSISPNSISTSYNSNTDRTIVINGSHFSTNSTALWNGSSRPTYYNSNSQITMTLYANDSSSTTNGTVSVTTPNCGNSNGVTLTITTNQQCSDLCPPPPCYNCYSQTTPTVTTLSSNVSGSSITFNGSVNANSNTTTAWFRYGTSSYAMTNETTHTYQGSGSWATNFSATVNAAQNVTYYYQAVANNAYGTVYGTVLSTTATNYNTPTVTTVIATNKTTTTARLNGIATGYATTGYFEYGETSALGNVTPSKNIGLGNDIYSVNFSDTAFGLQPGTIYYFRAVASNTNGTTRGNVFVFQTPSVYTGPVVTTPTVTPAAKNELISITTSSENLYVGDTVEYFVTYKNNTKTDFQNTVITVQLPKEIVFEETNFGRINKDNGVVFNVTNLIAGQVGSITIRGHVGRDISTSTLVTTAIMSYNIVGSNVEKNEVDFVTNNIIDGNNLAAASLFGAGFMPTTLIGWIVLLLIILALIALIRHLYLGYNNNNSTPRALV